MLAGYLTGALILVAAVVVGQAAMSLCGRRGASLLSPAVGLAILLIVADSAIRLPGRATTAAVALLIAAAAGAWVTVLGRVKVFPKAEGRHPRARLVGPLAAALLAAVAASIPFLANGRMGPLGQGLVNDDMASHLLFTEWVAHHAGRVPDLVAGGYPLAPHSLVAAVAQGTGTSYVEVFGGLTLALAALAALTAYGALGMARPAIRAPAAALAALPYLSAAWLAQGAFKEPMLALFIVAFALGLRELDARVDGDGARPSRGAVESRAPSPAARATTTTAVPLGLIAAGALYAYSFPGLAWLAGTAIVWALIELLRRGSPGRLVRAALPGTLVAIAVVGVSAIPQVGRIVDFAGFGAFDPEGVGPKVGLGNLRQALNPLEGLSVWPSGEFRVSAASASLPEPLFYLGGLLAAAALAWGLLVALRRKESALPAALIAMAVIYLGAKVAGTPYTSAKALAIAAPVAMLVALRGLLSSEPPAFAAWLAPLRIPLAIFFVLGAVVSSFLPLRAGAVGPSDHADQLTGFRDDAGTGPVLYLGRDQFVAYELYPARLGTPVLNHYNVKGLPNRFPAGDESVKLDWDGLTPQQLDRYPYVITTRASFQSAAPPNFTPLRTTDDYILWRRDGPTAPREVLDEANGPGAVLACPEDLRRFPPGSSALVTDTPPVTGPGSSWRPAARVTDARAASQALNLKPGRWAISLEYVASRSLHLKAPGLDAELPASLDFRGPAAPWPAGVIEVTRKGPVRFTVSVDRPPLLGRLIGAEAVAFPLTISAMPAVSRELPLGVACGRYVDFVSPPG